MERFQAMQRLQAVWRRHRDRKVFLLKRRAASIVQRRWTAMRARHRANSRWGKFRGTMQTGPVNVTVPLEPLPPSGDEEPTLRVRHRCQRRPRNPMPRIEQVLPDLEGGYGVYVLANLCNMKTYVGCTNNWVRRLRQHCSFLRGGAKSTRGCDSWYFHALVTGFATRSKALSFEWYLQKYPRLPHSAFEGHYWPPTSRRSKKIALLLEKFGSDRFPNLVVHHPPAPDRPSLVKEYWDLVRTSDPDEYQKWVERKEEKERERERKRKRKKGTRKGRKRGRRGKRKKGL